MKPFFSYYGGKFRLSRRLGRPKCDHVIEPFAGSACFSTYWQSRKVTLVDLDPVVIGTWKLLKRASRQDIERLPGRVFHIDDLPSWVIEEERWLIGFWLDRGLARPGKSLCKRGRSSTHWRNYWSEDVKYRIISQLDHIRHWNIIEGSYEDAPDVEAHWHIDSPYNNNAGRAYRINLLDYKSLAEWCKSRKGYIQVCENEGATWLPFKPLAVVHSHRPNGNSQECVYEQDNRGRKF
jgi:hypothetical protein